MTCDRPSFLLSKAERSALLQSDLMMLRYEDIYAGKYTFEGMPDDMPADYPCRALFWAGALGCKRAGGRDVVLAAHRSLPGIYGEFLTWMPYLWTGMTSGSYGDLFEPSDKPAVCIGRPLADRIRPYVSIMDNVLGAIDQNVTALSCPVLVQGTQGGEINTMVIKDAVTRHERVIPCLDKAAITAQALDLGAQDNTMSLTTLFRAMDAECLTLLGVRNTGTEKASGVTSEETLSVTQELEMSTEIELRMLQDWCDRIAEDPDIGLTPSVHLSSGWKGELTPKKEEADAADDDGPVPEDGDEDARR